MAWALFAASTARAGAVTFVGTVPVSHLWGMRLTVEVLPCVLLAMTLTTRSTLTCGVRASFCSVCVKTPKKCSITTGTSLRLFSNKHL